MDNEYSSEDVTTPTRYNRLRYNPMDFSVCSSLRDPIRFFDGGESSIIDYQESTVRSTYLSRGRTEHQNRGPIHPVRPVREGVARKRFHSRDYVKTLYKGKVTNQTQNPDLEWFVDPGDDRNVLIVTLIFGQSYTEFSIIYNHSTRRVLVKPHDKHHPRYLIHVSVKFYYGRYYADVAIIDNRYYQ